MSSLSETHEFRFLDKKPSDQKIYEMVQHHFDLEASHYDEFDAKSEKRRLYTNGVNRLTVDSLPTVKEVLTIACGTGRRDLQIRAQSGQNYTIYGIEISEEMSKRSRENGILCTHANWIHFSPGAFVKKFDAAFFLYAFGAIPNSNDRLIALKKIRSALKDGAPLFLDVLNIEDKNEWGPSILEAFKTMPLIQSGYEVGDIQYSKIGDSRLAFWHYFSEAEIKGLLNEAGFENIQVTFIGYGSRSGEIVDRFSGAILLKAW